MKKSKILILLSVFLLLLLAGCSAKPIEETVAREEVTNYFEGQRGKGAFSVAGDVREYQIADEVERTMAKDKSSEDFYYTVTTVVTGGRVKGQAFKDYFEPNYKEVAKYKVTYTLADKKEWKLSGISKSEVISCAPVEGVREEGFLESLKDRDKIYATVLDQTLAVDSSSSLLHVQAERKRLLYKETGEMEYIFVFNQDSKMWELKDNYEIGFWDYEYTFDGNTNWMYETSPDKYGGKTYVALQLSFNKEENRVSVTYAAGYVDKYNRGSKLSGQNTWSGTPSADDPLVFKSSGDKKKLKIVDNGSAINFDGYTFYKVK